MNDQRASWFRSPSHHIRAKNVWGSPSALHSGVVKIKGVLCDLLICSTLITWDQTFRQAQWASCDGTLENINEFLDHLWSSTMSSAMDPRMMGTSKLMSTSITWSQELRWAFEPSHNCVHRDVLWTRSRLSASLSTMDSSTIKHYRRWNICHKST